MTRFKLRSRFEHESTHYTLHTAASFNNMMFVVRKVLAYVRYWVLCGMLWVMQQLEPCEYPVTEITPVPLRNNIAAHHAPYTFAYHMQSSIVLVRSFIQDVVAPHIATIMHYRLRRNQFMFVSQRQHLPKWIKCSLDRSITPDTVIARAVDVDEPFMIRIEVEYALVVPARTTVKLVEYCYEYPHTNFMLFGFFDGYAIITMINYSNAPKLDIYVSL